MGVFLPLESPRFQIKAFFMSKYEVGYSIRGPVLINSLFYPNDEYSLFWVIKKLKCGEGRELAVSILVGIQSLFPLSWLSRYLNASKP